MKLFPRFSHFFLKIFILAGIIFLVVPFFTSGNGFTDAIMVYDNLNGFSTPKYRIWDGTSWGSEQSASPVHGTEIYHMQVKYSPTRNEAVLVVLTNTGEVQAQVFDGTSWGSAVTLSVVGDTLGNPNGGSLYRGFDLEYEQVSGRAVVVAGDNTADPNYYLWNGTTWSNGANIDIPTTGRPYWIELAARPGSDELGLVTLDSNSDVYGMRWTGTGWNNMGTTSAWETNASASTKKAIDVNFEQTSGDIFFVWGQGSDLFYRTYTGGILSSSTRAPSLGNGSSISGLKLAPNSTTGSNQIMVGVVDIGQHLNTYLWDGLNMSSVHPQHASKLENAGVEMDFDIAFETHTNNPDDAWLVWNDGVTISEQLWDGTTSQWQSVITTGDHGAAVLLNAQPNDGTLLGALYEDDSSVSDDIKEIHLQGGAQTWSPATQIWDGGVRRNMGIIRMAQATQKFDNSHQAIMTYVTDDSVTFPQYRRWNGTSWSIPQSTSPINGELRHMVLKTSPKRDEAILVTLGNNGRIEGQVWNGTTMSWSGTTLLGTVADVNGNKDIQSLYRGFDVEYENNSGDAIVVFGNSTSSPYYVVWNGSTWSTPTKMTVPNTGIPNWIELAARPGSDEMAMIFIDSNVDVYGMRWTGNMWDTMGAGSVWDSTASVQTKKSIDVAYETTSGDILFVWGDSKNNIQMYRTYSGVTLSPTISLTSSNSNGLISWVNLVSNPTASSNQIMYGFLDESRRLNTYIWSGTNWSAIHPIHTSNAQTVSTANFGIVYETHINNPGDAWLVYGDGNLLYRQLWDGPTATWKPVSTQGFATDSFALDAQQTTGAVFLLAHESSLAPTPSINENHIGDGSQIWGNPTTIFSGPVTRTALPLTKIALATERFRSPSYTLHDYRLYKNINSADIDTPLAAQNTPSVLPSPGAAFRLRVLMRVDVNNILTNADDFKLQFAEKSGTCDNDFVGEVYQDVTRTSPIAYNDNSAVADGAALIANINDPVDGGRTLVNQSYKDEGTFTNSQAPIAYGQDGKWDFSLFDNGATPKMDYCFRVVRKTNSGLINFHQVVPEITTANATGLTVDIVDNNGTSIPNPIISMNDTTVTIESQVVDGIFGNLNQKIRVKNTTANPRWTLTLAADNGATALWHGNSADYDFNDPSITDIDGSDPDTVGGRLTLNPNSGVLLGTCTINGVTKGNASSFVEGSINSVTLLNTNINAGTNCYFDFIGTAISQRIPGGVPLDKYAISMTLTATSI